MLGKIKAWLFGNTSDTPSVRTFSERLAESGYDLNKVPELISNKITWVIFDKPRMIDDHIDHAIDETHLSRFDINPFTREPLRLVSASDKAALEAEYQAITDNLDMYPPEFSDKLKERQQTIHALLMQLKKQNFLSEQAEIFVSHIWEINRLKILFQEFEDPSENLEIVLSECGLSDHQIKEIVHDQQYPRHQLLIEILIDLIDQLTAFIHVTEKMITLGASLFDEQQAKASVESLKGKEKETINIISSDEEKRIARELNDILQPQKKILEKFTCELAHYLEHTELTDENKTDTTSCSGKRDEETACHFVEKEQDHVPKGKSEREKKASLPLQIRLPRSAGEFSLPNLPAVRGYHTYNLFNRSAHGSQVITLNVDTPLANMRMGLGAKENK